MAFVSEGRAGETWKNSNKTMLNVPKQVPLTLPLLLFRLFLYYVYLYQQSICVSKELIRFEWINRCGRESNAVN